MGLLGLEVEVRRGPGVVSGKFHGVGGPLGTEEGMRGATESASGIAGAGRRRWECAVGHK